jgi:hypothetical protein
MNLEPIHSFLERVKQMQTGRSKEMRMSYEEANKLALTIAQLLVVEAKKVEPDDGVIIISGGPLKPPESK